MTLNAEARYLCDSSASCCH